jgi:8-oxo-dGTP pyrophosphatase MutT (NUDIX family)
MALPGGRHEKDDAELITTAIRETAEEVGITLSLADYLGALPVTQARSRTLTEPMTVTPFVFRLNGERPQATPNYEVAEIIWLPLSELTQPERKTEVLIHHQGQALRLPAIQVNEHKIWGLTYGVISSLLCYLAADDE